VKKEKEIKPACTTCVATGSIEKIDVAKPTPVFADIELPVQKGEDPPEWAL
jgi:hypothetical protein